MKTSALRSLVALSVLGLLVVPSFAADDPAATDLLGKRGLTRVGTFYELDVDAHLGQRLAQVHKLEADFQTYVRKRQSIEGELNHASTVLDNLIQRLSAVDAQMNAPDARSEGIGYNQLVVQHNTLLRQVREGRDFITQRTTDLNHLTTPPNPIIGRVALQNDLEAAQAKYTQLAADADVTGAITTISATGPRLRLGPSPLFVQQLPLMRRQHEIDSKAAVQGTVEGNLLHVSTMLNGTATIPMIVDSGASVVSINAAAAKEAGVEVKAGSEPITMQTASGEQIQAQVGVIKSLSVGGFTVTDVPCAIMPAKLGDVDCLLGETFLSQFLFQIDLNGAELRLTPISSTASAPADAPAAAEATTRPATSRPTTRRGR